MTSPEPTQEPPPAEDWKDSLADFIATRLELIRFEARDAGRETAKRAGLVIFIMVSALLIWILLLAGLIGLIAAKQPGWPWYGVTFGVAALHLLLAAAAVMLLRKPSPPSFPLTRSELSKDREWLNQIHHDPKPPR